MSYKLTQVFYSLPPEAQHVLVEKHLAGLVDLMPREKSKKILLAATNLQRKYRNAPKLDIRVKRKQVDALLDELTRDAKISFIKERSNREELLSEIIHSLVGWLNDIWSVVYEHRINFSLAHRCLLFISDALSQLCDTSIGGCKCFVLNLPIRLVLKDKRGNAMKRFSVMGPQNINQLLLWIWRDLFVSLLANGTEGDKKNVPDFLHDIESALGGQALERLLYGGKRSDDDPFDMDASDTDEEEVDFDDEEEIIFEDSSDEDEDDVSECYSDRCGCDLHARYWPERLNQERLTLREHVEKRLFTIFELTPSLAVYNTLMTLSLDALQTDVRLNKILSKVAGDTPNNLVAALDIYTTSNEPDKIASVLESYSYLLRPRDAITLQCAVAMLNDSPFHSKGLAILEKELNECMHAIRTHVRSCFSNIDDEENKKELKDILKLRKGTPERKQRVVQWGERVITASNAPMHPMAFAAMMMGLPMMPGVDGDDDADILNYVDLDQDDPDFDDLRDEYRPNLKATFDGWTILGQTLKGGSVILARVYLKALEIMPWLSASDTISEMSKRLRDRPNKTHVLDALLNVSSFGKSQRKKLNSARAEMQQRNNAAKSAGAVSTKQGHVASSSRTPPASGSQPASPAPASSTSQSGTTPSSSPFVTVGFGSFTPTSGPAPPISPPFSLIPGGMEDVD